MIVPEGDKAAQQIRTPQKWAVRRSGAADDDMVSAPGTGMAAIDHEFFGAEAGLPGQFIESGGAVNHFPPAVHGLDVYFNNTGIRGDLQTLQTIIGGWRIAFDDHRQLGLFGRRFNTARAVRDILQGR